MKSLFLVFLSLLTLCCQAQNKTLPANTPVSVQITQDVSSKTAKEGDVINFVTSDEVIVNDYVMVHKGLRVTGRVTKSIKSKGKSKSGILYFTIDKLYLNEDKSIKLTTEVKNKGKDNSDPAVAVVLNPFLLLKKGKNAKLKKGQTFIALVEADTVLDK